MPSLFSIWFACTEKIDEYIQTEMKAEQIPGLCYAVALNNKVIDSGAYGYANLELKAPVTPRSLFNIGSIGKTFTATGIMLLQQDGKLSINDLINKYLDSLPDSWKNITIKNLLNHTSGIAEYIQNSPSHPFNGPDRTKEITEAEFISIVTNLPLDFQPGEQYAYRSTNFVLLGFIIHKVSGKPQAEFMKERVFGPLGMSETRYTSVSEIIPNRASGYVVNDSYKLMNGIYVGNFYSSLGDMGIITTATDLAKWCGALESEKILDEQSLQQMWTHSKLNSGIEVYYGLGWELLDYRGNKVIGHEGGFLSGYTATFAYFPEKHLSVAILANLNPTYLFHMRYRIAGFFMPELKPVDQLGVQTNADTSLNKTIYTILEDLRTKNYDLSLFTQSLIDRMSKAKISPPHIAKENIVLVGSDKIKNKNFERYGVPVEKIICYKVQFEKRTIYVGLYVTAHNKVTDISSY